MIEEADFKYIAASWEAKEQGARVSLDSEESSQRWGKAVIGQITCHIAPNFFFCVHRIMQMALCTAIWHHTNNTYNHSYHVILFISHPKWVATTNCKIQTTNCNSNICPLCFHPISVKSWWSCLNFWSLLEELNLYECMQHTWGNI